MPEEVWWRWAAPGMLRRMSGFPRLMSCLAAASLFACAGDDDRIGDGGPGDGGMLTTSVGSMTSVGSTAATSGGMTSDPTSATSSADTSEASSGASESTAGSDDGTPERIVPEFALLDVNPTSATFEQLVSPRDHLERASGWYFTEAT
jgi:hypothetical protein